MLFRSHIFEDTIKLLCDHLSKIIRTANIENLTKIDGNLSEFCSLNGLSYPETYDNKITVSHPSENTNVFQLEIFGNAVSKAKLKTDKTNGIIECIKKHVIDSNIEDGILFTNNEPDFTKYFDNEAFRKKNKSTYENLRNTSVAIYINKDKKFDLHFTHKGIVSVFKNVTKKITSYSKVKTETEKIVLTEGSYPLLPSTANFFAKTIHDVNKIEAKYKPADEKEEHTAIDELFSELNFDVANDEFFQQAPLVELEKYFSKLGDHELEEMLQNRRFNKKDTPGCIWAIKNVLKSRGYSGNYITSLEN